jgi:hypothetical protein
MRLDWNEYQPTDIFILQWRLLYCRYFSTQKHYLPNEEPLTDEMLEKLQIRN